MDLLDLYDAEMRADPALPPGLSLTRIGGLVRLTGAYNLISYASLPDEEADAYVTREVRHFRDLGEAVEWKVHGHDRPADLAARLARAGFVPDPMETLMVFDLAEIGGLGGKGAEIRQVDAERLDAFLEATEAAFGHPFAGSADDLRAGLEHGTVSLHVAYVDGRPVGAGRLETPPGRAFAGLYSGGVSEASRHKGVYRALVRARAERAAAAGYRYLIAEALETSRPILERLGFRPLTTVQGWLFEP
ncbi:MAG: hypothetical protein B7Y99_08945 [Caulobacterales bacterium 32-69-10]|nr:MAG: hypothetical protein B7Y99_08945 [Caulobacterales bacterium 32-69-10]